MSDNLQAPCRNCGLPNATGRDFCEQCGEYLSWAPTMHIAAVQASTSVADEDTSRPAGARTVRADGPEGGRSASFEDDDDGAATGLDDEVAHAPPAERDGAGDRDGDGRTSLQGEDGDEVAPPPEHDDARGPLARAADEAAAAEVPGASAAPATDAEDTPPAGAAGVADAGERASDRPSKGGRHASGRRARPDIGGAIRRARPRRGRATPEAEAEAQAIPPVVPVADPVAISPASPAADAVEIPPASPEADAVEIPPASPEADAEATPSAAPDVPADTAAMLAPSDGRDVDPAPPSPLAPPPHPLAPPPHPLVPPPPPLAPPPPPAAATAPIIGLGEAPAASGDASIVLTPEALTVGAAGVPAVEAGGTLSYNATIRNESRLVDNYELAVLGLPEGWSVVTPPTAFLVPLGSGRGESDTTVRIDITPPRVYRSTAGIWTFELIAMSRTTATVAGRAIAQFEVRPFPSWSVEAVPVVNSGRLKARYRIAVRNDGNADQDLWLLALEDSGRLRMRYKAGALTLQPGTVGVDVLTLRPRLPLPVGRVKEHRVGVDAVGTAPEADEDELSLKEKLAAQAKQKGKAGVGDLAKGVKLGPGGVTFRKPRVPNPAVLVRTRVQKLTKMFKPDLAMLQRMRGAGEAAGPLTARQVVFRQKPIVPLWFLGLLLLLALIGVAIYLLLPKEVKVPQLVGSPDTFTVEKKLRDAGLVLSTPVQKRQDTTAEEGSVIEQSPAAGIKLETGSAVSVIVAEADAQVEVPLLTGLTRVGADKRLRQFDLELGETKPDDAADNFVVKSQIPAEDLTVDKGTSVRVFLEKPKKKAVKKKKAAAKGGAGAGGAGGGGAGGGGGGAAASVAVPAFKGKKLAAYTQLLVDLGLKATISRALSELPENAVIRVEPAVGKKTKRGTAVKVIASGGPPTLAVQIGGKVRTFDASGPSPKPLGLYPIGGGSASELDYGPTGQDVVYRSGDKLMVSGTANTDKPRTLYAGADTFEHPAFAPNGQTLAVIRREEGDGDLCFGIVSTVDPFDALCLPDDGWDLDGRISWRPDGKALLVPGRRASNPSVFGLRLYETDKANATAPEVWRGATATNVKTPGKGVLAGAFSPTGGKVAAISNLKTDGFELFVAEAGDLELEDAQSSDVAACDVAWSPDAKELAVVQAGEACSAAVGTVKYFPAGQADAIKRVAGSGSAPVYRPVK